MRIFLLALLVLLSPVVRADPSLIVPGVGIGRTNLGPDGTEYLKRLPSPDAFDAGMMQDNLVWTSKTEGRALQTLYIHTVANGATGAQPESGVTIDQIRVTSPIYHTPGGLHPGSTFAAIRHQFPDVRKVRGDEDIYDDVRRGIAFEFAPGKTRCIAITVYPKGSVVGVADAAEVRDVLMNPADRP